MPVSIILLLWPLDERQQLEEGDLVEQRDIRRLLRFHRRAAAVLPRLQADGWEIWYTRCALWGDHPGVTTKAEARARLAGLGIPAGWVELFGGVTAGPVAPGEE